MPRVRAVWQALSRTLRRSIRYRMTLAGSLFTLATLAVTVAAILTANNLLLLLACALMSTLLVSGLVSRLCLAGLEVDYVVPEHVAAGQFVPGRMSVRNQKLLMPSFAIRVEGIPAADRPTLRQPVFFPLLPIGATLEQTVEARFPRRGLYRTNGFAVSTAFPFGFLDRSASVTLQRETLVYPRIDPQPGFEDLLAGINGEIESHYRGLGRDFYRIRPYEAFESARHVDWKASAHVGTLQVREFAREQEPTVELFLDRELPHDLDAWFEQAIACCAFLAWRLSGQGTAIHFRSNGYRLRQPEDTDIFGILKYLALVYPRGEQPPEPPFEPASYQLVFTVSPEKFRAAGWGSARVLCPETLPTGPPSMEHRNRFDTMK
ncbi:MAG: DUF58 domain-containing protein [Bryobacteraceae bacterium]